MLFSDISLSPLMLTILYLSSLKSSLISKASSQMEMGFGASQNNGHPNSAVDRTYHTWEEWMQVKTVEIEFSYDHSST